MLKTNTPFARNLRRRQNELKLQILASAFNLPQILKDIQQDDHPTAVDVRATYLGIGPGISHPLGVCRASKGALPDHSAWLQRR
eukprot:SAG31_NODE_6153_length_2146_cov_47.561798_1_plen_83_part_10